MESKDNSSAEQSSPQFCQEVGSTNSMNSIMDNTSSVGGNGDCPKCSICKKRLARKSEYTVCEFIWKSTMVFVHILCHFFDGAPSFHLSSYY